MPMGVTSSMHWCDDTESFNFQHHQRDRKDYDGVEDSDSTVALKYRVIRTLASGTTVSVVQRLVGRRFIEQNRVVGIWKTYTEGEGAFRGMHSTQTGWSCLRPMPDGSGTVGEVCVRQNPVLFNASPSAAREFYRFLQASLDEDKHETLTVIHKSLPERFVAL
ncbi:hypothetical protein GN244_ATG20353 [Phytophthora infestans]|uniref:Uncharacterized protein n=1 Tax=Phytophthora infestans TaxID=4787 RepID=A0A833S2G4_PHYIN|nr:hypothetical protein GN244_ATG20353 [Phytophthora infestans]